MALEKVRQMAGAWTGENWPRDAVSNVWARTLSQIPTCFGRLYYLASLRNPNTGLYEHHGLAHRFGAAEADAALRSSHEEVFAEWLNFPLARQKADFDSFLAGIEGDRATVLGAWLTLEPYRNLPPVTARPVERELYLAEIQALLELLRNESGVAFPDPDA
jgi:hypothetical protein